MNLKYKWQKAPSGAQSSRSGPSGVQSAFLVNKETNESTSGSQESLTIGSCMIVSYLLTLLYVYGTALINTKAKYRSVLSLFNINTLSTSFQHSEKIGTTILLILFLALLQGFFSYQGINASSVTKTPVVWINYAIIICWLLLMFIFPLNLSTNPLTAISHGFIALVSLGMLIANCYLILDVYDDYYDSSGLKELYEIGYALTAVAVFAILVMILNMFTEYYFSRPANLKNILKTGPKWGMIPDVMTLVVSYAELACFIMFAAFMAMFMQYPAVPLVDLVCQMIPKNE